jgi:hypothetical protein
MPGLAQGVEGADSSSSSLHRLPQAFVENRGQWPEEIRYALGRGPARAAIFEDGFAVSLLRPGDGPEAPARGATVRFRFEGETPSEPLPEVFQPSPGRRHYFLGSDPGAWQRDVPAWARLRFEEAWPGVDLVLREGDGLFEYDLVLAPGADLSQASIVVEGALDLQLDAAGQLLIATEVGTLIHTLPVSWTVGEDGGERTHPCEFRRLGPDRFGFIAPPVPEDRYLVVDPGVRWSTFLGHEDHDVARVLAIAPNGEVVVAGNTYSPDFPVTPGSFGESWNGGWDAFVMRISADGSRLVYSAFLGGSGSENISALALTDQESVYVGGETSSSDFPITSGSFDGSLAGGYDGFVALLHEDGDLIYRSTYLGGNLGERLTDLVLDDMGRPLVCGSTASSGFPTVSSSYDGSFGGGASDAFLSRFSADLASLEFSTFLGSTGAERAECLAVNSQGEVTLGGWTQSTGFPTTAGVIDGSLGGSGVLQDGFLTRFDAQAQNLIWSTLLGGSDLDSVNDLVLLVDQSVAVVGETDSVDFPLGGQPAQPVPGGQRDAFVTRISASANQVLQSSYFGGSLDDSAQAVTQLPGDRLAVCGTTSSADLVFDPWVFDTVFGQYGTGQSDAFVARYEPDGSMSYGTYIGGGADEAGMDIESDGAGGVVLCGETNSANFPITPGAFDLSYDFSSIPDGFLTSLEFIRFPFVFGDAKINSLGSWASLSTVGFPSLTGTGFTIWVDSAYWNSTGLFFYSEVPGVIPFAGGQILMSPPFQRTPLQELGWLGSAGHEVAIDPTMVGTTRYYQFWYVDPGDPFGVGLSAALEVPFYP